MSGKAFLLSARVSRSYGGFTKLAAAASQCTYISSLLGVSLNAFSAIEYQSISLRAEDQANINKAKPPYLLLLYFSTHPQRYHLSPTQANTITQERISVFVLKIKPASIMLGRHIFFFFISQRILSASTLTNSNAFQIFNARFSVPRR